MVLDCFLFALKGKAAVSFDGEDDQMWTGYDFDSLLQQTGYSIITFVRLPAEKATVLSLPEITTFTSDLIRKGIGVWRQVVIFHSLETLSTMSGTYILEP